MPRRLLLIAAALLVLGGGIYLWKRRGGERARDADAGSQVTDPLAVLRQTPLRTRWAPAVCKPSGVVRTREGAPAAGAVVTLHAAPVSARVAYEPIDAPDVRAGADGRYQLPATAAGTWTLVAALPDVSAAIRTVTIKGAGDCGGLDLALGVAAHAVTGTVIDVNGGGVKDAMVVARAALAPTGPPVALAMTALDGRYRLAAPEGNYLIQVRHPDYVGVDGAIAVRGPTSFDATLTPGSSVRGTVMARDSRTAIPGARVTIRGGRASGAMGGLVREVVTDDDGKFVATGLGSGRIFLSAVGPNQANRQPLEIALGIAENRTGVEIMVDPARRIRGIVTRAGAPVGNALVSTLRADVSGSEEMTALFAGGDLTGADHPVETDGGGVFEVWGLVPAVYSVTADAPSSIASAPVKVDVTRVDADAVALELRSGVVVRGRVEPPQVANVSLGGAMATEAMMRWTGGSAVESKPDGTFELAGIAPGEVSLTAETYGGLYGESTITVGATGANDVVIKLVQKGVVVAGRVVDPSGKPVAGVVAGSFGVTSTDGTFRATVEPGEYMLNVSDGEEELELVSPAPDNAMLTVPAGGLSGIAIVVEARDRTLRGIVIGADGKPAPDAWVVATRAFDMGGVDVEVLPGIDLSSLAFDWTGRTKVALTDGDGRFAIAGLRKGVYDVAAEGAKGHARGVARGVNVDAGTRIQLVALAALEVAVAQGGKPVARYTLVIEGPEPDTRTVDAVDGRLTITSIPPGEYTLRATTEIATGKVSVAVGQGATARAAIALAGWATVTGTVVDASTGAPIVGVTAWIEEAVTALHGDSAPWITDAAGKFKLERVPPGRGEVAIYTGGGEPVKVAYTATDGATFDCGTIRATRAPPTPIDLPEPAVPEPAP